MIRRFAPTLILIMAMAAAPGMSSSRQQGEPSPFRLKWNKLVSAHNEQTSLLVSLNGAFSGNEQWRHLAHAYNEQTDLLVEVREQFDADPPEDVQSLDMLEKMRRILALNKKCRELIIELVRIQFNVKINDK